MVPSRMQFGSSIVGPYNNASSAAFFQDYFKYVLFLLYIVTSKTWEGLAYGGLLEYLEHIS